MSVISSKMLNDSIGAMNRSAYYGSSGSEPPKDPKERDKERIKNLKSKKSKKEIKKILLLSERDPEFDKEIDFERESTWLSHVNKKSEEADKCKEIAREIRKRTMNKEQRKISDNLMFVSECNDEGEQLSDELDLIPRGLYNVFEKYNVGFENDHHEIAVYATNCATKFMERHEYACYKLQEKEKKMKKTMERKEEVDPNKYDLDLYHLEEYRRSVKNNTIEYQKVIERLERIKNLQKACLSDRKGVYRKKGIIELPIRSKYFKGETISLEITQKELIQAGYIPEELKWHEKNKTKISARDIAEADKEQSLTTTEVGGAKGFFNKIRDFFKGKGEK